MFFEIKKIRSFIETINSTEGVHYLRNLIITNLSQLVSLLTVFFLFPLLHRQLSDTDFIEFTLVQTFISSVSLFDLGLSLGLLSEFTKKNQEPGRVIVTSGQGILFFLLVCYLALYLFVTFCVEDSERLIKIYTLGALILLSNVFTSILESYFHSREKYYITKTSRILKNLIEFAIVVLVIKHISIYTLLAIFFSGSIIYLLFLFYFIRKIYRVRISFWFFNIYEFCKICRNTFWIYLMTLSGYLVLQLQLVVLKFQLDAATIALYLFIFKFFEFFRSFVSNVNQVLIPRIAIKFWNSEIVSIRKMYFRSLGRVMFLLLISSILLIYSGPSLFHWWSSFSEDQFLLPFFLYMVYSFFLLLDNVTVHFLIAIRAAKKPTIISLLQGILVLFCTYYSADKFGITGVVAGSILALLFTSFGYNVYVLLTRQLKTT